VADSYVARTADAALAEMLGAHPAVLVVGPRATGKTTTGLRMANESIRLGNPAVAAAVNTDPFVALSQRKSPLLIDEWQIVPETLAAVKQFVDEQPSAGQFILTGSVRGDLDSPVWPGTGRLVRLAMFGLTEREIEGTTSRSWLDRLVAGEPHPIVRTHLTVKDYVARALRSGFPEPALSLDTRGRTRWLSSYVDQLVTRDAQDVDGADRDPQRLRRYLEAMVLHTAGVVDDVTLYTAANLNKGTSRAYNHLLQNLLILDQLPAWTSNRLKRLSLSPKRFVVDAGLLVGVLGVTETDVLSDVDLLSRVLETFVVSQLRAEVALMVPSPRMHHLRTAEGRQEIDLLIEVGHRKLVAVEIKATSSPDPGDAKHLRWLKRELNESVVAAVLLHCGSASFVMDEGIVAAPIAALWS
jgi:uncharacterized protein